MKKELETLIQTKIMHSPDIEMEFGIAKCAMLIIRSGKWWNNGRNRTAKSINNQDARRKGKLQALWSTGSGHHETRRDERKNTKGISDERENFLKPISSKG